MQYVEDQEQNDTPCWVGFAPDNTDDKIPITYQEEEAAKWILMGWDVGHLPEGLSNSLAVKWLT